MTSKCVICHKKIWYRFRVCRKCIKPYGNKRSDWPEWLHYLAKQADKELDRARGRTKSEEYLEDEEPGYVMEWDEDRFPSYK